jgi:hypothetical protein
MKTGLHISLRSFHFVFNLRAEFIQESSGFIRNFWPRLARDTVFLFKFAILSPPRLFAPSDPIRREQFFLPKSLRISMPPFKISV